MVIPTPALRSPPTRRSWREFCSPSSFSRPDVINEALLRLRRNLTHFRLNYTLISLTILFLSILFHPISLIVFILISLIWYYLYFSDRETAVSVFGWEIGDGVVLLVLSVVTVLGIGATGVWVNVVVSVALSVVVVFVHGVFRNVEDLYCDEEEGCGDGLLVSVVGSPVTSVNKRF